MTDEDKLDLAEKMRAATGAFVRLVRHGAGTPSDARLATLAYLDARAATAAELARRRGVTHQTARVLLAQMRAERLVESGPDPDDARAVRFSLTRAGAMLLKRSRDARAHWIADQWISRLSAEEEAALRVTIKAMDLLKEPAPRQGDATGVWPPAPFAS